MSGSSRIIAALRKAQRPLTEEELAAATGLRTHDVTETLEILTAVMAVRPSHIPAWVLVDGGPSARAATPHTTDKRRRVKWDRGERPPRTATGRATMSDETRRKISESQKRRWASR